MEWDNLLNLERLGKTNYPPDKHRPPYLQDMDRILFSQPFRRLANKTQVRPLYDHDHVHHRLIHSLEVTSVGRSLGIEVGAWLADRSGTISPPPIDTMAGLVQTACMAHDIGNPPFGHAGEEAIASWFREKFDKPTGILAEIPEEQRHEFKAFEGNAQGFRILARTEMYKNEGGLRLCLASLGAFTKYPVSANIKKQIGEAGTVGGKKYIGLKKYGFFENDVPIFQNIADRLGLVSREVVNTDGKLIGSWWSRHPLTFLMEAADDICYNIMDLEDAYIAGDVSSGQVIELLQGLAKKRDPSDRQAQQGTEIALAQADGAVASRSSPQAHQEAEADRVSRARALAIGGAISACVEAFTENYHGIMAGTFNSSLIEESSQKKIFEEIEKFSKNQIFKARKKTELEIYGRNVIYRLLNGLLPLLDEACRVNWKTEALSSYHNQVARALEFPVDSFDNAYDALHALTDFVSGTTDRYAVKVADMFGGG